MLLIISLPPSMLILTRLYCRINRHMGKPMDSLLLNLMGNHIFNRHLCSSPCTGHQNRHFSDKTSHPCSQDFRPIMLQGYTDPVPSYNDHYSYFMQKLKIDRYKSKLTTQPLIFIKNSYILHQRISINFDTNPSHSLIKIKCGLMKICMKKRHTTAYNIS